MRQDVHLLLMGFPNEDAISNRPAGLGIEASRDLHGAGAVRSGAALPGVG